MSYFLSAFVAKQEVFAAMKVPSKELANGYSIVAESDYVPFPIENTKGMVAFLGASFHGGGGEQDSIVYQDGEIIATYGPSYDAIDEALKQIGVIRTKDHDEFDVLGLGRCRDNDWHGRNT